MAIVCEICGKKPIFGHSVSHAHNVTRRKFYPNLRRVRIRVGKGTKTVRVCARCLKSARVRKA